MIVSQVRVNGNFNLGLVDPVAAAQFVPALLLHENKTQLFAAYIFYCVLLCKCFGKLCAPLAVSD